MDLINATVSDEFADALVWAEGGNQVLGPHYKTAQATAERIMTGFEEGHFKPLIEKFASDFQERLWEDVKAYLLSDTEMNLQGDIWRGVDESVKALLTGEKWALDRYVLGNRYEHGKIREALAKLIPAELQDLRVADLEAQVASLKQDLEWARR